jgi:hypothetical protein
MTCEACERARGGENDPRALLSDVTDERALVLRVEIEGTTNTLLLRQIDADHYQSRWRANTAQAEQTTCRESAALALIDKLLQADSLLDVDHCPVGEISWSVHDNQTDDTDGEEQ